MLESDPIVLIVEPSRLLRQAVEQACQRRSVRVKAVPEVGKALSIVSRRKPTAILTALELPGLSGASLIAALKCCVYYRAIPIGLMTATESPDERVPVFRPDVIIRKEADLTASVAGFLRAFGVGRDEVHQASAKALTRLHGRILLAEDSAMIHMLISRFLHVAGAEAVVVEDGAQAVDLATHQPFDLILMDIEMPVMNGLEATRVLRDQGLATPIIACTAHRGEKFYHEAMAAGVDSIVNKPAPREGIIAACAQFLDKARQPATTSATTSG